MCVGHGKLIMCDESYYEGEFQNGEITGHGYRFNSNNDNKYSGQFNEGKRIYCIINRLK